MKISDNSELRQKTTEDIYELPILLGIITSRTKG